MATMTIRTTVAFDPATVARWERLTRRWGTSKSEALRRALEAADREATTTSREMPDFTGMSPGQILDWLKENPQPPILGGWGDDPHREMREMRERDAELEEERAHTRSEVANPRTPCLP